MADISSIPPLSDRLQALCLSRPIQYWDGAGSGAAVTEQGPRPGLPVAGRDSHLVVEAAGPLSGTADLEARVQHAGLPGQIDHGLQMAVRRTGSTKWVGWEPPGTISSWEGISYDAANDDTEPDIATLSDDTVVAVARRGLLLVSWTRNRVTGAWTGPVTIYDGTGGRPVYWPCLVVIGAEVYCLAWRRGHRVTSVRYRISAWRSADSGATWGEVQNFATTDIDVIYAAPASRDFAAAPPATAVYYAGRIRAAYRDGEVVVVAHMQKRTNTGQADYIRQWAGASLTARLDLVGTFQASTLGWAWPDVVATTSGFTVAFLERANGCHALDLGSAWQPLFTAVDTLIIDAGTGAGWTAPGAQVFTGIAQLAIGWDPSGVSWVVVSTASVSLGAGQIMVMYRYSDSSWYYATNSVPTGGGNGWVWIPDDLAAGIQGNYPQYYGACWQRGRLLLAHDWISAQGPADASVAVAYLGGWTNLCLPVTDDGVRVGDHAGYLRTWLPFELGADQLYTTTTAGTFTAALSTSYSGSDEITTGDGAGATGSYYYADAGPAAGVYGRGILEYDVAVALGGSLTGPEIYARYRIGSATNGVSLEMRFTTTGMRLIDLATGGTLATVAGLTAATMYSWRLGIAVNGATGAGRAAQLWYRLTDHAETRLWIRVGQYTPTDDAGASATSYVEWGHRTGGNITQNISNRRGVRWNNLDAEAGVWATWDNLDEAGGDNPVKLNGRPVGTAQVYALDGATIAARRGPGLIGDTWSIPVSGDYEIARAFSLDTPSPRIHHRSVGVSSDVVIPWAVDAARPHVEDADHPPLMALVLWCNWRLALLQSKTVAGAWTTRATIDTRVIQGTAYTRTGLLIQAAAATNTYLHRDELDDDWTVEFSSTGEGAVTRYRHPSGNSPGRWSNNAAQPKARIELKSTLAGDPTGATGVCSVWSPHIVVLVEGVSAAAWRLVIDSTHGTADGDYRTKFQWCEAHILARAPDWGRSLAAVPGHERAAIEGDLGVRVERAPAATELQMAWEAPVDETSIHGAGSTRFVTFRPSGEPESTEGELPLSLVRMLQRQAGRPVTWCTWPRGVDNTPVVLRRAYEQLTGTVASAPDIETDLGYPGDTESSRIAKIAIRQER